MDTVGKEKIESWYNDLPPMLKSAVITLPIPQTLYGIGRDYGLSIDKIGAIAEEVTHFISGTSKSKDFIKNLLSVLGGDKIKTAAVAEAVNVKIFIPIRDALKKATTAPAPLAPKPLPPRPPEPVKKPEPLVISPIPMAPMSGGTRDQALGARGQKPVIQEIGTAPQLRPEGMKIPEPKPDLGGKISPIISRIGIRRTADGQSTEDREQGLGIRGQGIADREQKPVVQEVKLPVLTPPTSLPTKSAEVKISPLPAKPIMKEQGIADREKGLGITGQGVGDSGKGLGEKTALPMIEEMKQPKVVVSSPIPEPKTPPSPGLSRYEEIKAEAERELQEFLSKQKTEVKVDGEQGVVDKKEGVENSGQGIGINGQKPVAQEVKPTTMPATTSSPAPKTPPAPGPLKLPEEKIPKPEAPERYATDPYKEPIE